MKKHFTKDFLRTLVGLSLALVIGLGVNYVAADWQGPSGAPTAGNPNNLLTTGSDQIKTGKLSVKSTTTTPMIGPLDLFGLQVGDYANAYNSTAQKGIWSNGPLGVAGNSGLYGSVDVGPTMNTSSPVTMKVTGNVKVSDSAIIGSTGTPNYNLHLVGDTNIGMGNTCSLPASEAANGCPIGSYVFNVQYVDNCEGVNLGYEVGPCTIVKCRYVNPVASPQDLGICGGSSGSGSTTPMTVTLAHNWPPANVAAGQGWSLGTTPYGDGIGTLGSAAAGPDWTTTGTAEIVPTSYPLCVPRSDYTTMTNVMNLPVSLDANLDGVSEIVGGVPPYTYTWYKKEYNGIFPISFVPFSVNTPTTGGWTWAAASGPGNPGPDALPHSHETFNVKTYHINRQDDGVNAPVLKTYYWAVLVTDATGAKATDQFGAHDLWHCPSGYPGNN